MLELDVLDLWATTERGATAVVSTSALRIAEQVRIGVRMKRGASDEVIEE